jgi:hypothetical protein
MSRRRSMGKIKRYRRSFYSGRFIVLKKVVLWIAAIAALFVIGFWAAPAILNWGTHTWYTKIKGFNLNRPDSSAQSTSVPESQPASSEASSVPPADSTAEAIGEGTWAMVSLSSLGDSTAIQQTAADLAAQNVHYAVIPLKDASGYIYYPSALPNAAKSISATTVDAAAVASALKAQGITPVAYLSAFQDPTSCYADRTMAIHYSGSDYLWLDAAADAGGKPWLNPYSDTAVQFIGDLVEEVSGMGYEQVVLSAVQFPAYVSAKQDFGNTQGSDRAAQLAADITAWQTRFADRVTLWYEMPYAYCAAASTALGEKTPDALGIKNLVIQMPAAAGGAESEAAASSGETAITLEDVVNAMKNGGCAYVAVRDGAGATFY